MKYTAYALNEGQELNCFQPLLYGTNRDKARQEAKGIATALQSALPFCSITVRLEPGGEIIEPGTKEDHPMYNKGYDDGFSDGANNA